MEKKGSRVETLIYLGREILKNSRQVDGGAGSNTLGILSGLEKPCNPPHRKLKPSLLRPRYRLWGLWLASTSLGWSRGTHLQSQISTLNESKTLTLKFWLWMRRRMWMLKCMLRERCLYRSKVCDLIGWYAFTGIANVAGTLDSRELFSFWF